MKTRDLKQFDQTTLLGYIRSLSEYGGKENELLERIADYVEGVKSDLKDEMVNLWNKCIEEARADYPRGCEYTTEKMMNFAVVIFKTQLKFKNDEKK